MKNNTLPQFLIPGWGAGWEGNEGRRQDDRVCSWCNHISLTWSFVFSGAETETTKPVSRGMPAKVSEWLWASPAVTSGWVGGQDFCVVFYVCNASFGPCCAPTPLVSAESRHCPGLGSFLALHQLLMALGLGHALSWGLRVLINGVKIAQGPHRSPHFPSVEFAGSLWVCHVRKHQPCVSASSEKPLLFNK